MSQEIFDKPSVNGQRRTQKQKDANKKQWYKDQCNMLDKYSMTNSNIIDFGNVSDYIRKKVNYDLFNNQLNMEDLAYVCKPFGETGGELPANMVNRDIVSPKIKVLLGMEMKMPFSWKVIAVNREATTRKEEEENNRIKDWVQEEIMKPIRLQVEQQAMAQAKGRELTPEEKQQLQAQIDEQVAANTPDKIKKYMSRDHQDPAEVMMSQILEFLVLEQRAADKFNKGFKHSLLGGEDLYHVGIFNGKPGFTAINNLRFNSDQSEGLDGVEDGQWATCEYRWTPNEVISKLGSELTEKEIDRIYDHENNVSSEISNADFSRRDDINNAYTVRVLHTTWKSLMKIGFLIYTSADTGQEEMMIVDENYKLNEEYGDISIQWEWIPETHECWKILNDIYVYCRPVPGQHKDINNLWEAKLPYYGAACDNMNSVVTSAMDRIKYYQYYYDIILYRMELALASDKGKKLLMNINAIPKSAGIDTKQWLYFFEANGIGWVNPSEEGNRGTGGDVTNMAKEVDMSMANNIQQYITIAEYIDRKCGEAIGVTKPMEGQVGPTDAVTNTKQNIVQASHIVQPYFELHNIVKGKVLKALIETAKVAYSQNSPGTLSYVLDDMTTKMLTIDENLLDSSTYGLFLSNSGKAQDAKNAILQLAQAAMQNQQVDMLDVIKIIKSDDMNEAEELLTVSMQNKQEQLQASEKAKLKQQEELENKQREHEIEGRQHEADMIILKAKEDRQTKKEVAAIQALGFNENKDVNNDGIPDVIDLAGLDLKGQKQDLDERKFQHQQQQDKKLAEQGDEKLKNEKEKIKLQKK